MIIVEGMDNSGKTTLCNQLKKHFGFELTHSPSKLAQTNPKELLNWTKLAVAGALVEPEPEQVIYDRFPLISEYIYGPVLRGNNVFDEEPSLLIKWLQSYPVVVYCRPPDKRILDFGNSQHMSGVREHAIELLNEYDRFLDLISNQVFVFRYNFLDAEQKDALINRIQHTIRI